MLIKKTVIPEIIILYPEKYGDHRGFFSETFNSSKLQSLDITMSFVQDNQSLSGNAQTLRGLHYQAPPFAQDKLVRVTRGAILDVAVDIRQGSPTFGRHVAEVISAEKWNQILVPKGFAHGFITLESNTEVIYKVSNYYAPDHDFGIKWNDPALGIEWNVSEDGVTISEKDKNQPLLSELETPFKYKATK